MAYNKQPQLSGAYYRPSIHPPKQPRHNRDRSCCCYLFGILWKLLVAIIVLVILIFLVFFLIVQPRAFNLTFTKTKLTQFNYTVNNNNVNTLHYNLVLNFTACNSNKKLNIYYDKVEGHAFYEGTRFASMDVITWLNFFCQYTKSTDRISGVFSGQRVVVSKDGVLDIDLKLYFAIRFMLGDFIPGDAKAKAKCELHIPFGNSNGTTMVTAFMPTKCDVNF